MGQSLMGHIMQRGLACIRRLSRIRRTRGVFWRMCGCGKEFSAIGRRRKVTRRLAEAHIQRCRAKATARLAAERAAEGQVVTSHG